MCSDRSHVVGSNACGCRKLGSYKACDRSKISAYSGVWSRDMNECCWATISLVFCDLALVLTSTYATYWRTADLTGLSGLNVILKITVSKTQAYGASITRITIARYSLNVAQHDAFISSIYTDKVKNLLAVSTIHAPSSIDMAEAKVQSVQR